MAQRNHKYHKCADVASNAVENKYVSKWALKVVGDSPVSRRLNGSSFHACGPAAAKDRSPKAQVTGCKGDKGTGNRLKLQLQVVSIQNLICQATDAYECTAWKDCLTKPELC